MKAGDLAIMRYALAHPDMHVSPKQYRLWLAALLAAHEERRIPQKGRTGFWWPLRWTK